MPLQKTTSKAVSRQRRPRLGRAVIAAALMIIPMLTTARPASATAPEPPPAVLEDCRENAVVVPGVGPQVRQRVPSQFELVRDPIGRPLLAVVASRCDRYTVNGTTRPTTF